MARIPLAYNLRNLAARRLSTGLTALGIALVAWVFIFTLALAGGFQAALTTTGTKENAIIIRKGSTSELMSILTREAVGAIESQGEIARAPDGTPLAASELMVVWNLPRKSGTTTNVVVRGVGPKSFALRPKVKLVRGRMFRQGFDEIMVGRMVAERFQRCDVGDRLKLAGREWTVVGVFDSKGSTYDSEIWGDVELFMPVFDRPVYQSLTLRLAEPGYLAPLKKRLESDPRMNVEVEREDRFYADQSGQLTSMLRVLGLFVTSIMSLGAIFGALNTMYAAVGNRTREIGTLRAIGFSRGAILTSFLIESVLLALLGGLLGCLLALPVRSFTTGTMSFATFSELAFRFQVTPGMLLLGLAFSAFMGLLGGFLPARKAATMPIVDSLRQA
ncbi:MAG TPA: ABC transporter permease [Candidatus Eisenbacteria bacterium]|jgi:ABC-type lipoprotein release transport system permease subunit|nr:ABC transporter permease [Candidatus Eisenbacteria bacterium]